MDCKPVCISNSAFFLTAIYMLKYNSALAVLVGLIGYCSHKHHNEYQHQGYRILDWLFAIIGILIFIFVYYNKIGWWHIISFILAICFWLGSILAWRYERVQLYGTLHSIWHIQVCLEIIKLVSF